MVWPRSALSGKWSGQRFGLGFVPSGQWPGQGSGLDSVPSGRWFGQSLFSLASGRQSLFGLTEGGQSLFSLTSLYFWVWSVWSLTVLQFGLANTCHVSRTSSWASFSTLARLKDKLILVCLGIIVYN